ncbi:MAG: hypothetical protein H0Z39_04315 [Peptococcaceae bacterium]|nr:hypothetical protein [Peptococcaceae bacterium]
MTVGEKFGINSPKPVCVGTGFIALDIVMDGRSAPPKFWAGGSCGNVLTILSYLGWESYPIARLGDDEAAVKLLRDMEKWKVRTSLVLRDRSAATPMIVLNPGRNRNGRSWRRSGPACPNYKTGLARYKPVLAQDVTTISREMPGSQVFYFDQVSRSSIELAKITRDRGALVVFEPSEVKEAKLLTECLQVADIVKYSHVRSGPVRELMRGRNVPLEIETLGAEGLKYCLRGAEWISMPAYAVEDVRDTVGCGDWCSAGIIHILGRAGRKGFLEAEPEDIDIALRFGQTLAALSCQFEGPRGVMYRIPKQKFTILIRDIWHSTTDKV